MTLAVTIALMVVWTVRAVSEMYIRVAWGNLLALGEEGGHNYRARSTQLFAAQVNSFGHDGLHGDSSRVTEGDSL